MVILRALQHIHILILELPHLFLHKLLQLIRFILLLVIRQLHPQLAFLQFLLPQHNLLRFLRIILQRLPQQFLVVIRCFLQYIHILILELPHPILQRILQQVQLILPLGALQLTPQLELPQL